MTVSGLSFLGLGIQAPQAEWGMIETERLGKLRTPYARELLDKFRLGHAPVPRQHVEITEEDGNERGVVLAVHAAFSADGALFLRQCDSECHHSAQGMLAWRQQCGDRHRHGHLSVHDDAASSMGRAHHPQARADHRAPVRSGAQCDSARPVRIHGPGGLFRRTRPPRRLHGILFDGAPARAHRCAS